MQPDSTTLEGTSELIRSVVAGEGKPGEIAETGAVLPAYSTSSGTMYLGKIESFLDSQYAKSLHGKVNLIFTSPPFPLNRKKKYGNLNGDEYLKWLESLAPRLRELLAPDGSLVIELGNSWEPGTPTMSTLALEALLGIKRAGDYHLCQQFICNNPARLPSPAQWVTVERVRVKDSFTHVWWMAPSPRPKASNRNVLEEYSPSMKALLERGSYNSGKRGRSTTSARPRSSLITAARFLGACSTSATPLAATATDVTSGTTSSSLTLRRCRHASLTGSHAF